MSRILRRPMFRGGRVDSRGTGITSGLSYAKGGQVQPLLVGQHPEEFKDAEGREQHWTPLLTYGAPITSAVMRYGWRPAMKYGRQGINWGKNLFKPKPMSTSKELVPYKEPSMWQNIKDFTIPGISKIPGGTTVKEWIARNPKKFGLGLGSFGLSDWAPEDWGEFGESAARWALPGKAERWLFDEKEKKTAEQIEIERLAEEKKQAETLERMLQEEFKKDKKARGTDTEMTEEEMAASTKKYERLLGGDKATGRDVTDMLLGFAGKALKPEATLKSAFGEFFEEEDKRPSRREGITDKAAALAINEYIAGKKSKQELDRFFLEMNYKKGLTSRRGKENVETNVEAARKSGATGYNAIASGLRVSYGDRAPGAPIKLDVSEKGQTAAEVPLLIDNVDKIFIEDEAPYNAVLIEIDYDTKKIVRTPIW